MLGKHIYDSITLCIHDFENFVCVPISFLTFRFCNMLVTTLRMVCQSIRPGISLYLLHSSTASKESGKDHGGGCYSLSRTELCSRPGELVVSFVFIIFFSCISQSPLFIFLDFSSDLTFLVFFHLLLFYLMMMIWDHRLWVSGVVLQCVFRSVTLRVCSDCIHLPYLLFTLQGPE